MLDLTLTAAQHHAKPEDVSIRPADPVRTRDSEVKLFQSKPVRR